jgi:uncharacterized protein
MILIDANLLLYAYNRASDQHERARVWLEDALAGTQSVLLPWPVVLAFLRISTSSRVWPKPLTVSEACQIIATLLGFDKVTIPQPGEKHWQILTDLLETCQCRDALIVDAHLAALAIEHGATICTDDRDFSRFPGLKVLYPLV